MFGSLLELRKGKLEEDLKGGTNADIVKECAKDVDVEVVRQREGKESREWIASVSQSRTWIEEEIKEQTHLTVVRRVSSLIK